VIGYIFVIGMTNRFFQTLKFYPAGFYGREIYGKFAIITFARSVHGAICSTSLLAAACRVTGNSLRSASAAHRHIEHPC
jgi:hypothetical protein